MHVQSAAVIHSGDHANTGPWGKIVRIWRVRRRHSEPKGSGGPGRRQRRVGWRDCDGTIAAERRPVCLPIRGGGSLRVLCVQTVQVLGEGEGWQHKSQKNIMTRSLWTIKQQRLSKNWPGCVIFFVRGEGDDPKQTYTPLHIGKLNFILLAPSRRDLVQ